MTDKPVVLNSESGSVALPPAASLSDAVAHLREMERNPVTPQQVPPQPVVVNGGVVAMTQPMQPLMPPPVAVAPPPMQAVIFVLDGFGEITVPYHQVIKQNSALVLIYNSRFIGGMQYTPPSSVKAIKVKVQRDEYEVQSLGLSFDSDDGLRYTVLRILPDKKPAVSEPVFHEEPEQSPVDEQLPTHDEFDLGDDLNRMLDDIGVS